MRHVTIFLKPDGTIQSVYAERGVGVEVVQPASGRTERFEATPGQEVTCWDAVPGRPFTDRLTQPAVTPPP